MSLIFNQHAFKNNKFYRQMMIIEYKKYFSYHNIIVLKHTKLKNGSYYCEKISVYDMLNLDTEQLDKCFIRHNVEPEEFENYNVLPYKFDL